MLPCGGGGQCPGLSRALSNHRGPYKMEGRVRVRKKRYDEGSRDKSDITLKWPQAKESRQLLEAEKAGKQHLQKKPVLTTP